MAALSSPAPVGELLRASRRRRSLSQLELSLEAAISSRHLSFVETGRAQPSCEMLLRLAEHLEVTLRARNGLLLYAPLYPERSLQTPEMDAFGAPWTASCAPMSRSRRSSSIAITT